MMNSVKYSEIFTNELNYVPDKTYFEIIKDIQAYIILNNTINIADFITFLMNDNKDKLVRDIINNHSESIEMNEIEFMNYIKIVNKWIVDEKIKGIKEELKSITDINRKKELMDMITNIKRGSDNDGK